MQHPTRYSEGYSEPIHRQHTMAQVYPGHDSMQLAIPGRNEFNARHGDIHGFQLSHHHEMGRPPSSCLHNATSPESRSFTHQRAMMSSQNLEQRPPMGHYPFDPYRRGMERHSNTAHANSLPLPLPNEGRSLSYHRGPHLNASTCVEARLPYASHSAIEQQPTYVGHIKSAQDAILLLAACDLPSNAKKNVDGAHEGYISRSYPPPRRVTRRLLDAERGDLVTSGCVFAWDEKEAGMRRWTDGRVWSASRVSGCFLTYRELEARKKANNSLQDGPTSNQYKAEGLIKQSFSVTTASGRKLHVISYFTKRDVREGRLRRVSEDPRFVGESGGEWGLQVDEKEFALRESQGNGVDEDGVSSLPGAKGDEDKSDGSPSPSSHHTGEGHEQNADMKISSVSWTGALQEQPLGHWRKRSSEGDLDGSAVQSTIAQPTFKRQRPSIRPTLKRMRSSSFDAPRFASDDDFYKSSSSVEGPESLNTSVPSISEGEDGLFRDKRINSGDGTNLDDAKHTSVAYQRKSALREQYPPHSQPDESIDNANAIGALLSLASAGPATVPSSYATSFERSPQLSGSNSNTVAPSAPVARPLPERHDSDRHALNMFKVRL